MAAREMLYELMAESNETLPADTQTLMIAWAISGEKTEVLCNIARRSDLTAKSEQTLLSVRNADVAKAWMSVPTRSRRFAKVLITDPAYAKETRIGVLSELAKLPDLPEEVYQRCADRDHYTVAVQLLANLSVSDSIRRQAVVSVMHAPKSIRKKDAYRRQIRVMLFRNPELIDEAVYNAPSPAEAAVALLTPGVRITDDLAKTFADATIAVVEPLVAEAHSMTDRHKAVGYVALKLQAEGGLQGLLYEVATQLTLGPSANRIAEALMGAPAAAESNQPWYRNRLGDVANELAAQTGPASGRFVDVREATTGATWRRALAAATPSKGYNQAAMDAAVWSSGFNVDDLMQMPRARIELGRMNSTLLAAACTYHLGSGRKDKAVALAVLGTYVRVRETDPVVQALETGGVTYGELAVAGVKLNLEVGGTYHAAGWAQEAVDLTDDLVGALKMRDLLYLGYRPEIRDRITARFTQAFGSDTRLWSALDMLTSREFHGTLDELIDATRNLVAIGQ